MKMESKRAFNIQPIMLQATASNAKQVLKIHIITYQQYQIWLTTKLKPPNTRPTSLNKVINETNFCHMLSTKTTKYSVNAKSDATAHPQLHFTRYERWRVLICYLRSRNGNTISAMSAQISLLQSSVLMQGSIMSFCYLQL